VSDPTAGSRLTVDADLQLSIDGVETRLVGRRNDLTLRTDEPARLASALRRGGVAAALPQLERRAAAAGLATPAVTIEGPRGRVARFAPGERGLTVRGLPADTRLRVHRPQDLVPAPVRRAAVVALVLAAIIWGRRR
jgi:hypothetical protein